MHSASIDIQPVPGRVGGLCGVRILGVGDCQFTAEDQVRRQATMGMRPVVGIAVSGAVSLILHVQYMYVMVARGGGCGEAQSGRVNEVAPITDERADG